MFHRNAIRFLETWHGEKKRSTLYSVEPLPHGAAAASGPRSAQRGAKGTEDFRLAQILDSMALHAKIKRSTLVELHLSSDGLIDWSPIYFQAILFHDGILPRQLNAA
jgi:hypothetical protein